MRVHGLDGLRVVDASSMPYVTNGNIYAPVMMLAEKSADLDPGQHAAGPRADPVLPARPGARPDRAPRRLTGAAGPLATVPSAGMVACRHPSTDPSVRCPRALPRHGPTIAVTPLRSSPRKEQRPWKHFRSRLATTSPTRSISRVLRRLLPATVIRPDDAAYESARQVHNAAIDRRPSLIVRAANAADVARTVVFARDTGLELAVRGGSHSLAGYGTVDGGIVLDLSAMKGLHIDASAASPGPSPA